MPPTDGGLHPDDELSAYRRRQPGAGASEPPCGPTSRDVLRASSRSSSCGPCATSCAGCPLVDPPFGFFERTLRQGPKPRSSASRRLRNGLILTIVALLAIMGVVLLVHHRPNEVTPDVSQVLHDYTSVVKPVSVQRVTPLATPVADLPASLAGATSSSQVVEGDEGSLRRLQHGRRRDRRDLERGPAHRPSSPPSRAGARATAVEVAGNPGFVVTDGDVTVLAVERGSRVYTVVAAAAPAMVELMSGQLPSPDGSTSITDQAASTGKALLETFGIGG